MKKVALIGIGGMGFVHYNAYKKIEGAKVIAVADPRVDMAKGKIGEDDVKVYATIEELFANEKPDMVDVCTPSYMHADLSIYAMEQGCDVLCEKPMSVTEEDTARIIAAQEKTGKTFMVAHVVRFMAPYVYLKSVIDSGELGRPVHIQMKRISSVPSIAIITIVFLIIFLFFNKTIMPKPAFVISPASVVPNESRPII